MDQLVAWLDAQRGRRTALAADLRISPSALSMWDRVPVERALDIERITGISRYVLRPDIYGPIPEAAE